MNNLKKLKTNPTSFTRQIQFVCQVIVENYSVCENNCIISLTKLDFYDITWLISLFYFF